MKHTNDGLSDEPIASFSIYERVMDAYDQAWSDGYDLSAVRMHPETISKLSREMGERYVRNERMSESRRISWLNTPSGRIIVIRDEHMPKDRFIGLVEGKTKFYQDKKYVEVEIGEERKEQGQE